jgi:hypothetical protein
VQKKRISFSALGMPQPKRMKNVATVNNIDEKS